MWRRLILLLALILLHGGAFEVPYPQSSTEIRGSIESSSSSIVTQQLTLGSGTTAEVISCLPSSNSDDNFFSLLFGVKKSKKKPVLAFVHGSFHASWCWTEKYVPFFASLGYPCFALSLQGTGGTPTVEKNAKKVRIDSHVADLDAFLRGLSHTDTHNLGFELGDNPQVVVLGHSFGGLSIMKWLEKFYSEREDTDINNQNYNINLCGVALLCSVPPSGNGPMTMRFLKRSLKDSWTITAGFVLKKAISDKAICRDLFFGGTEDDNGISDADIQRYQSYFERDTVATIDLADLSNKLPSTKINKETGNAPFVDQLPPSFVIAASDDFVVDKEGSRETARYLGIDLGPVIIDSPHDIMLGDKWRNGADAILAYLQGL